MAQAIVTQIGPRARIVGTVALLTGRRRVATLGYVGISVVIVRVVAIVITVVIAIVVVARADAEREGRTAEPAVTAGLGKISPPHPAAVRPIWLSRGQALSGDSCGTG